MAETDVIRDKKIVNAIKQFIREKKEKDKLNIAFPNSLLKDDVLELLDRYCTVVYYPLDNEKNNGFHITNVPDKNGKVRQFVFINTAQTMEKQVFTAAHELGHIWEVDEYVARKCNIYLNNELREHIINRFAAELLIPEEQFTKMFTSEYANLAKENGKISIVNMLRIIARLMNFFFVPMKSVVLRFYELQIIDDEVKELLLGRGEVQERLIQDKLNDIIIEDGYTKISNSSNKKWIDGLAEMLDKAEASKALPEMKINRMRAAFNLPSKTNENDLDSTVELNLSKEDDICNEN